MWATENIHTVPLSKQLKILPLDQLSKYSALKFMNNLVNRKLTVSFADTWMFNRGRNLAHYLRNAKNFHVQAHHFTT